jgi:adenylate cyclase
VPVGHEEGACFINSRDTNLIRELRRGVSLIPIEPKVFDLLEYLIRNRDRVVSKDDLITTIWRGRIVSESALSTRINAVRKAVGDSGKHQRLIRTIPRKGIRFVGDVRQQQIQSDEAPSGRAPHFPQKPSIAILAFSNMGGEPTDEHFADGIAEEITTVLGRVPRLFVIARNSSFAFKGMNTDVREIGGQLGVRYVLEGSVRRSGERLRVTAELIDCADGTQLWADRYERQVQDVFDIQDELTKEIVTALRIQLTDGEQASVWLRSTKNVEAWGYAMRGADHVWRGTAADMLQARFYLERAAQCDPHYAKAVALIGLTHYFDVRFHYALSREDSERKASEFTSKALLLNPEEPYAVWMQALIQSLQGQFEDAVATMKRALAKSPGDANCWLGMARVLVNAGRAAEAEPAIRYAIRLNPFYPVNYLAVLGDVLIQLGRSSEALTVFDEILRQQPNYISAHLHLAGLHGQLGDRMRARAAVAEVLRLDPNYRIPAAAAFYLSADVARKRAFLENLRAAGLPD